MANEAKNAHTVTGYARPPIREAAIVIEVAGGASISVDELNNIKIDDYPDRDPITIAKGVWKLGETRQASATTEVIGYHHKTAISDRSLRLQNNLIALSFTKDYPGWEDFHTEFLRHWDSYAAIVRPASIERIGLRYVNILNLPLPLNDFADYLTTNPQIAKGLPQSVDQFVMQLSIPLTDIGAHSIITQTIVPPTVPDTCGVVLDIDVFVQQPLAVDRHNVLAWLTTLRAKKNEFFEASITDRTRGLFV